MLLLGHSPGIPDLVEHLCVRTDSADWAQLDQKYPTSGLAVITLPGPWRELGSSSADLVASPSPGADFGRPWGVPRPPRPCLDV